MACDYNTSQQETEVTMPPSLHAEKKNFNQKNFNWTDGLTAPISMTPAHFLRKGRGQKNCQLWVLGLK